MTEQTIQQSVRWIFETICFEYKVYLNHQFDLKIMFASSFGLIVLFSVNHFSIRSCTFMKVTEPNTEAHIFESAGCASVFFLSHYDIYSYLHEFTLIYTIRVNS